MAAIETAEQFAFLRAKHCDEAQGYYFSRPASADDLSRALVEQRVLVAREPRLVM